MRSRSRARRIGRRRRLRRDLLVLPRLRGSWPAPGSIRVRGGRAGVAERGERRVWSLLLLLLLLFGSVGVVGRGGRRPFGLALPQDVLQLLPVLRQILQWILPPPSPLLWPWIPRVRTRLHRVMAIRALSTTSPEGRFLDQGKLAPRARGKTLEVQ